MKKFFTLLLVLIPIVNLSCQTNNNFMLFKTEDVEIKFPGSYLELEKGSFYSVNNHDYKEGYFHTFEKEIHFCEDHAQKYETTDDGEIIPLQTVDTDDGYLCSLSILPLIEEKPLFEEIKKAFEPKGALASLIGIEKIKVNKHKVIKWKAQNGKTRLVHYMLKAKNHYYLFISSPYGDGDYVEKIISEVKLLK
ncbi:MAG: hypothetical protein P1P88_18940 [Bacteroidales bacterium]|nr:hypothetical protein [Bacteroidales bacterium]